MNKERVLEIIRDEYPENPRKDCDHLGKMVCWHSHYNLGDDHDFSDNEDFQEWVKENPSIILPLYLYDHSGLTMNTSGFFCQWDSGQVGWIYVTLEDIRKEWNKKRISKKLREQIIKNLTLEVEEYDSYLTGDVYGFNLKDLEWEDGEDKETAEETDVDSCWGFYGSDYKTNGILHHVDMDKVDMIEYR